jgi:hypothetical protein
MQEMAFIKECDDTLFIGVQGTDAEALASAERVLAAAAREAGAGCVVMGPFVLQALDPPRCYGRVEVKPRGSERRMLAARGAAVTALAAMGYEVFGLLSGAAERRAPARRNPTIPMFRVAPLDPFPDEVTEVDWMPRRFRD